MSGQFSGSAVIDRPIQQVFDFLVAGTNDPKFSPRVLEIRKETDGPPGVGTVFVSRVKDAGMKTDRRFELTELVAPTTIRWTERSKNVITVPEGGYDLEAVGDAQTKLTIFNSLRGPRLRQAHRRLRAQGGHQGRRRIRRKDQGGRRGGIVIRPGAPSESAASVQLR